MMASQCQTSIIEYMTENQQRTNFVKQIYNEWKELLDSLEINLNIRKCFDSWFMTCYNQRESCKDQELFSEFLKGEANINDFLLKQEFFEIKKCSDDKWVQRAVDCVRQERELIQKHLEAQKKSKNKEHHARLETDVSKAKELHKDIESKLAQTEKVLDLLREKNEEKDEAEGYLCGLNEVIRRKKQNEANGKILNRHQLQTTIQTSTSAITKLKKEQVECKIALINKFVEIAKHLQALVPKLEQEVKNWQKQYKLVFAELAADPDLDKIDAWCGDVGLILYEMDQVRLAKWVELCKEMFTEQEADCCNQIIQLICQLSYNLMSRTFVVVDQDDFIVKTDKKHLPKIKIRVLALNKVDLTGVKILAFFAREEDINACWNSDKNQMNIEQLAKQSLKMNQQQLTVEKKKKSKDKFEVLFDKLAFKEQFSRTATDRKPFVHEEKYRVVFYTVIEKRVPLSVAHQNAGLSSNESTKLSTKRKLSKENINHLKRRLLDLVPSHGGYNWGQPRMLCSGFCHVAMLRYRCVCPPNPMQTLYAMVRCCWNASGKDLQTQYQKKTIQRKYQPPQKKTPRADLTCAPDGWKRQIRSWFIKELLFCLTRCAPDGWKHQIRLLIISSTIGSDQKPDDTEVSLNQFCFDKMNKSDDPSQQHSFSFWKWFLANYNLLDKYLIQYWEDDLIAGFLSKDDVEQMFRKERIQRQGVFILRFSDTHINDSQGTNSVFGFITAMVTGRCVEEDAEKKYQVISTEVAAHKRLKDKNLANILKETLSKKGHQIYKYLYPGNRSREEYFDRYCKEGTVAAGYKGPQDAFIVDLEQEMFALKISTGKHRRSSIDSGIDAMSPASQFGNKKTKNSSTESHPTIVNLLSNSCSNIGSPGQHSFMSSPHISPAHGPLSPDPAISPALSHQVYDAVSPVASHSFQSQLPTMVQNGFDNVDGTAINMGQNGFTTISETDYGTISTANGQMVLTNPSQFVTSSLSLTDGNPAEVLIVDSTNISLDQNYQTGSRFNMPNCQFENGLEVSEGNQMVNQSPFLSSQCQESNQLQQMIANLRRDPQQFNQFLRYIFSIFSTKQIQDIQQLFTSTQSSPVHSLVETDNTPMDFVGQQNSGEIFLSNDEFESGRHANSGNIDVNVFYDLPDKL